MSDRSPAVAGQFYQSSKAALTKELASLIDKEARKVDCMGAVSPHAGYIYSGAVAGKVISRIKLKESLIILGPNHTGLGAPFAIMSSGRWRMPMGDVSIDSDLASAILENSKYIKDDPSAHLYEHSIEVQLLFLQYLKSDLKFVPIAISTVERDTLIALGEELAGSILKAKREVVIIASSDMTHYEDREAATKKDRKAIDAILRLDVDGLLDEIKRWDITMCGFAPTAVMITALKMLGAKEAELVDYKTSGDVSGDYSSVVGYAGILIK